MTDPMNAGAALRDLGDGLRLRRGRPGDADALAAFNADVLRLQDAEEPQAPLGVWTRDLMTGRHPSFDPADALIVEVARTGQIVASSMLVSQVLSFAGVTVPAGQPELVGTRADLRGRGLVRAMFATLHAWSAERGHVMQFIAGIPGFYRQFGYELAIERGGGPVLGLDRLPAGDADDWSVRPLTVDDLAFAAALDAAAARRYLVTVPRDESLWRHELTGHTEASMPRQEWRVVEAPGGDRVAILGHAPRLNGDTLAVTALEVRAGVSWRAVHHAIVPYLRATGEEYARRDGKAAFRSLGFWWLGRHHPLCRVVHFTDFRRAGALYVRVPDVARVLGLIAPVLEARLASSPMAGHTGELKLGFDRDGVRLVFARGVLELAERWCPSRSVVGQEMGLPSRDARRGDAAFPGLTFLHLLFGSRSFEELEAVFADCFVRGGEPRALLAALFPKEPSDVWPVL
jgi:hypothetical protein